MLWVLLLVTGFVTGSANSVQKRWFSGTLARLLGLLGSPHVLNSAKGWDQDESDAPREAATSRESPYLLRRQNWPCGASSISFLRAAASAELVPFMGNVAALQALR